MVLRQAQRTGAEAVLASHDRLPAVLLRDAMTARACPRCRVVRTASKTRQLVRRDPVAGVGKVISVARAGASDHPEPPPAGMAATALRQRLQRASRTCSRSVAAHSANGSSRPTLTPPSARREANAQDFVDRPRH